MAVTTEYSIEFAAIRNKNLPMDNRDFHSRIRFMKFTFTQGAAAGDVNSLQYLTKLPAGKINVLTDLSKVFFSAFGAARTLDIGWDAYNDVDGDEVAADVDGVLDGEDVSAAGNAALLGASSGGVLPFHSQQGVDIVAKVLGDTIPAAATLKGWIAYTAD